VLCGQMEQKVTSELVTLGAVQQGHDS
jgi:hypothetical protein